MTLKEIANHLNVSERTASDWRSRGAPVTDVAEMVEWLKTQRHTKIATKEIINRRDSLDSKVKTLLIAYADLCGALSVPLQSGLECTIAANLRAMDPHMENLAIAINPEMAIDPKDRQIAERLRSEAWPVAGA